MKRFLKCVVLALGLAMLMPAAVLAQPQTRAYAPENLRTLNYNDQVRVISMEYQEQSRGRRIPDDQLRFYIDQVNRSNWGFSRIKQDISQSLAGGGGGGQYPGPGQGQGGRIRCESVNNRSQTCPTPWQGPSRLVQQLSGTGCVEGRNWQSQRGQIFVSGGCRGEFAAGAMQNPNYSVTCTSIKMRPVTCAWNRQSGRPQLQRQLSKSACVEGQTWGYDNRRGLWVNNGCSGRFVAGRQRPY
jgi:hypothetical protein